MATVDKSDAGFLEGDKLYVQRARQALPILVRQAKAGQPITYSGLAKELGMSNPRNMNFILGAIGQALQHISADWNEPVPMLQAIVLNKATGFPGEGFGGFLPEGKAYKNLPSIQKEIIKNALLADITTYKKWDEVLAFLDLAPHPDQSNHIQTIGTIGTGGEGPEHLQFKQWVRDHPEAIPFAGKVTSRSMEHTFPSGDAVDVAFTTRNSFVGVEVKSSISQEADIFRGLFQCVKYLALIRAEQLLQSNKDNHQVFLALEGPFPTSLIPTSNLFGINVVDNLREKM